MRKPVFFDSWGWIAVVDRKDPYHEAAMPFYQEYVNGGGIPITTDYILDEVFTVLPQHKIFCPVRLDFVL